jgi:hypothetical protein
MSCLDVQRPYCAVFGAAGACQRRRGLARAAPDNFDAP